MEQTESLVVDGFEIKYGKHFKSLVKPVISGVSIQSGESYFFGENFSKETKEHLWYATEDKFVENNDTIDTYVVIGNKGFKTAEACYEYARKKYIAWCKRQVKKYQAEIGIKTTVKKQEMSSYFFFYKDGLGKWNEATNPVFIASHKYCRAVPQKAVLEFCTGKELLRYLNSSPQKVINMKLDDFILVNKLY